MIANRSSVVLPYHRGLSEKLQRCLSDHKIKAFFKPMRTIGDKLRNGKDPVVADTLWSVHILYETPICGESTMQNNPLSFWQICSLLETTNKSLSHIRLHDMRERERGFTSRIKCANSFSLPTQIRERTKIRRSLNKNVTVVSILVTLCCPESVNQ